MLKVAIIGCGRISAVYKEFFKAMEKEISVVCAIDKDEKKAFSFANDFPDAKAVKSVNEIFEYDIDVLHICLPHNLHKEIAILAMKNGINVLTEKPVAIDCTEADEMIKVQKETGVLAGCIFQTRYVKSVEKIKETIKSGSLGDILAAKSILTWSRGKKYYEGSDWKGTMSGEGGGVLIDQAIHSIDRVRYILDDDVSVVEGIVANYAHDYLDVEDTAHALIEFKKGTKYSLYASNTYADNTAINIEFIGTKGKAGLIQDLGYLEIDGSKRDIRESFEGNTVGPNYWGSSHNVQIKKFYKAVREKNLGKENYDLGVDLLDSKKTLEIIRAIYKSSSEKRKVIFPYFE